MHDNDYLKYWRVIKYYYLRKHDMKAADLDMLLFLKSEKYFTKKKFDEFNQLVSWNKKRFTYLLLVFPFFAFLQAIIKFLKL